MNDIAHPNRRRLLLAAGLASLALPGRVLAHRHPLVDAPSLKIGIIGTGRVGGALAELWARAGHQLLISSRHPEQLKTLAERLGPKVQVGTPAEAAAFGEVLLISVPYAALPQIGRDLGALMQGKVVLETGNPFAERDGEMAVAARARGTGLASADFLPGVLLVRAFSTIPHTALLTEAHRDKSRVGVALAGDDENALKVAQRLVVDAGFEPVVVGPLARARDFDVGSPVFGKALAAQRLKRTLELGR